MTLIDQQASVVAWNEPAGLTPRGTLIVIPGRGELPALYERLGRRLAGDAYRVRVVPDPTTDTASVRAQVTDYLSDPGSPAPRVLVGSDTGALFAVILAVSGGFPSVDAVVLAGLPPTAQPTAAAKHRGAHSDGLPDHHCPPGLDREVPGDQQFHGRSGRVKTGSQPCPPRAGAPGRRFQRRIADPLCS